MSGAADRFKHESLQDAATIAAYLEALREGFKTGSLALATGERRLVLTPRGLVNLEVEAKRKGDEVKLSLKLRWSDGAAADPSGEESLLIEPLPR